MATNNITLDSLKDYLQRKYRVDSKNINGQTSLLHDLKFQGDDVDEFFSGLIKDFNIDVERLNLSRFYVGDEPFDFISSLIRFLNREEVN